MLCVDAYRVTRDHGTIRAVTRSLTLHTEPANANRITAQIKTPAGVEIVVATESNYTLDHTATPWLPPLLVAGMRQSWNVDFGEPLDSVALQNASKAQRVVQGWYPRRFHPVAISAEPDQPISEARGVGCFFSGGVDSFYSAITQSDRITHLIFVHGFDIDIDDDLLASKALEGAREAAADLGKPLIEIKTTVRSAFGDRLQLEWGYIFHGPALAHVGLALSQHLSTVIIPSSNSRRELHPWGSHPDLDPLWSSGVVTFEHHELELDRLSKIRRIGQNETAMNHLRVCWENPDGSFNCGRCAKCLRTKIGLAVAGAESATLPGEINLDDVRRMNLTGWDRLHLREGLANMKESGVLDSGLRKALNRAIRRSYWLQANWYAHYVYFSFRRRLSWSVKPGT